MDKEWTLLPSPNDDEFNKNDDNTIYQDDNNKLIDEEKKEIISDDGEVWKKIIKHGDNNTDFPSVMSVCYVFARGILEDGTCIFEFNKEEFPVQLGRGEIATGVQMALTKMRVGERAQIYCGKNYGYPDTKRPKTCPANVPLIFDVTLRWFEKEKNLHEMSAEERVAFAASRREIGANKFNEKLYLSAIIQYDKALLALEQQNGVEGARFEDESNRDNILEESKQLVILHNLNLAACYLKLKKYDKVIEYTNNALKLDKYNIKGLYRRGQAYLKQCDYDLALKDLRYVYEKSNKSSAFCILIKQMILEARNKQKLVDQSMTRIMSKAFNDTELYEDKPVQLNNISRCRKKCNDWLVFMKQKIQQLFGIKKIKKL